MVLVHAVIISQDCRDVNSFSLGFPGAPAAKQPLIYHHERTRAAAHNRRDQGHANPVGGGIPQAPATRRRQRSCGNPGLTGTMAALSILHNGCHNYPRSKIIWLLSVLVRRQMLRAAHAVTPGVPIMQFAVNVFICISKSGSCRGAAFLRRRRRVMTARLLPLCGRGSFECSVVSGAFSAGGICCSPRSAC